MATRQEFGDRVARLARGIAKQIDEAPTGVAPGYSAALGGTVLPNGRLRYVAGAAGSTLVVAAYINTFGGTAIGNTGALRIDFDTVLVDTGSAVTTGASWAYTVPADGIYRIEAHAEINPGGATSYSAGDQWTLEVYDGATRLQNYIDRHTVTSDEASVSDTLVLHGVVNIALTAAQAINIRLFPASVALATHEIFGAGMIELTIHRLT